MTPPYPDDLGLDAVALVAAVADLDGTAVTVLLDKYENRPGDALQLLLAVAHLAATMIGDATDKNMPQVADMCRAALRKAHR